MISNGKRFVLSIAVVLFLAALVPYLQTARFDFVGLDDDLYVTENPRVKEGLTPEGVAWAFRTFHSYNWHPLTWISHMADVSLFGTKPGGHHLMNAILHAANTLLLFLLLRTGTGALWRSAFVAALFALHPLHVESVAWISERKDLLSTLFGFGCIAVYFRYAGRRKTSLFLASLFLFLLSLLSKPTLVTMPFLLLLLDFWPLERREPPGRLLLEKVPFLLLSAGSAAATIAAQYLGGAVRSLEAIPLAVRVENALWSYVVYAWKAVWPAGLAVYYPHPMDLPDWPAMGGEALFWRALAGGAVLLAAAFGVFLGRKRFPWLATGWFWYLLTLVPMIGIVQVGSHAVADRYTYIPLVGLFLAAVWGAAALAGRWRGKRAFPVLAALAALSVLAVAGTLAFRQASYWRNSESLFRRAVQAVPEGALMHVNLGNILIGQGRFEEAVLEYGNALKVRPRYGTALYFLGLAWQRAGDDEKAGAYYTRALEVRGDREKGFFPIGLSKALNAHYQLGAMAAGRGDAEDAEKHFAFVMRFTNRYQGSILRQLAGAWEKRGNGTLASKYREKAKAYEEAAPSREGGAKEGGDGETAR
jgi:Flp pilus assembly protein TadD